MEQNSLELIDQGVNDAMVAENWWRIKKLRLSSKPSPLSRKK
jgi:hypothetical protein